MGEQHLARSEPVPHCPCRCLKTDFLSVREITLFICHSEGVHLPFRRRPHQGTRSGRFHSFFPGLVARRSWQRMSNLAGPPLYGRVIESAYASPEWSMLRRAAKIGDAEICGMLARYSGSLAYRSVPARRIEKAVQSGPSRDEHVGAATTDLS